MKERRWIYALGGLAAVLAIALVVVLVTREDDDSEGAADTTTTIVTTTTVAPTTTTVAPPTTTRPATPTTVPFPPITNDPESYAKYLFVSWQNANQQEAAKVASADAVTQMFSQAYSTQTPYTFGMCDPAAGSVFCTWTAQNGAKITMTVRNLTGGLPIQVVAVARS
jgi:hypothetical protein